MSIEKTPPPALNSREEAAMRALLRVVITLPRVLDADLVREQRMSLNEYSTLMRLSEAPDRRLRMTELAAAAALSMSGMTRIVTRLEGDGLIRRDRCSTDQRVLHATLTKAGLKRLEEMWPTHVGSMRRHALDHMQGIDLETFARVFSAIAAE